MSLAGTGRVGAALADSLLIILGLTLDIAEQLPIPSRAKVTQRGDNVQKIGAIATTERFGVLGECRVDHFAYALEVDLVDGMSPEVSHDPRMSTAYFSCCKSSLKC